MSMERLLERPPGWLTPLLCGAEAAYRTAIAWNSARTEARIRAGNWPFTLPRSVISVGNLVAGGTGKTPIVAALARAWLRLGGKPAILSRGYRRGPDGNDEFQLLSRQLPDVPHLQDPNRYRAGLRLLERAPGTDLFILDDGFQHRQLARDCDLVVLDATRPFGFGRLLPRGLLREPWDALRRAHAVALTRVELVSAEQLAILRTFLRHFFPHLQVFATSVGARKLLALDGVEFPLTIARRCAAFAGIGNPAAFFADLARTGMDVVAQRVYADHFEYRVADLDALRAWAASHRVDCLITTEKDGVKLAPLSERQNSSMPILQLTYPLELDADELLLPLRRRA
ncbi:MAG: tetraacyldisaccharide 4'-kinase [Planctomycetota bacterium]